MNFFRITSVISILYGSFALYVALSAFPLVVQHADNFGPITAYSVVIFITAILGLFFIFAERSLRAVRWAAARTGFGPIRFYFAVAMIFPLVTCNLSSAIPLWLIGTTNFGYLVAFILPGLVFRDLEILPYEEMSMQELAKLAGPAIKKSPRFRRLYIPTASLCFIVMLASIVSPQLIPAHPWASIAGWFAFILAVATIVVLFFPLLDVLPEEARARTLPGFLLVAIFALLMATAGYRSVLLNMLPVGFAHVMGQEVAEHYIILKVRPKKKTKACHGSVEIETSAGPHEICNLPHDFLEKLSPGNTLVISGKATLLGQTITGVRQG